MKRRIILLLIMVLSIWLVLFATGYSQNNKQFSGTDQEYFLGIMKSKVLYTKVMGLKFAATISDDGKTIVLSDKARATFTFSHINSYHQAVYNSTAIDVDFALVGWKTYYEGGIATFELLSDKNKPDAPLDVAENVSRLRVTTGANQTLHLNF